MSDYQAVGPATCTATCLANAIDLFRRVRPFNSPEGQAFAAVVDFGKKLEPAAKVITCGGSE
jgi:coenzyme F420-reducing hydrogenase gamma subunit